MPPTKHALEAIVGGRSTSRVGHFGIRVAIIEPGYMPQA